MSSEPEKKKKKKKKRSGSKRVDVLVLGASMAGVEVVYQLSLRPDAPPLKIAVVDRQREHGYLPLVQERLTGKIATGPSTLPSAEYINSVPGARFVHDEIVSFDPEAKRVELASGKTIAGRFVVVCLGSVCEPPPAIDGAEHVVPYKFASEFERAAARLAEVATSQEPGRVVVVGGGISGAELAGDLAALKSKRPEGWKPVEVTLVTADDRLLPAFPRRVGDRAERLLRAQGVEIRLGAKVISAHAEGITLDEKGQNVELPTPLALWAGGVRPAPILDALGLPRTDEGWLSVGPSLQCFPTPTPTNADVFACGDAVRILGGQGRWPTMQRAIECIWQAKRVAKNLATLAKEEPTYPDGVPPLRPHRLRDTFFYGVSLGGRSLIVYRWLILDLPGINHWFRRWLMRQYFSRYTPLPSPEPASEEATAE